ncbi:hypothetical protein D3C86_1864670 [compost metagenome]
MNFFHSIIKDIDLVTARDQVTELDPDQANEHTAAIQFFKQLQDFFGNMLIRIGIRYLHLLGMCIEIGVADLEGYTAG